MSPSPPDGLGWHAGRAGEGPALRQLAADPQPPLSQHLKQQRDKLKQYQRRVSQQLEREREIARQLLREGRKE